MAENQTFLHKLGDAVLPLKFTPTMREWVKELTGVPDVTVNYQGRPAKVTLKDGKAVLLQESRMTSQTSERKVVRADLKTIEFPKTTTENR